MPILPLDCPVHLAASYNAKGITELTTNQVAKKIGIKGPFLEPLKGLYTQVTSCVKITGGNLRHFIGNNRSCS